MHSIETGRADFLLQIDAYLYRPFKSKISTPLHFTPYITITPSYIDTNETSHMTLSFKDQLFPSRNAIYIDTYVLHSVLMWYEYHVIIIIKLETRVTMKAIYMYSDKNNYKPNPIFTFFIILIRSLTKSFI